MGIDIFRLPDKLKKVYRMRLRPDVPGDCPPRPVRDVIGEGELLEVLHLGLGMSPQDANLALRRARRGKLTIPNVPKLTYEQWEFVRL